ncbi:hypothetical protein OLX02_00560 [Novosphingobium sp. KCTC 2891]|uniref:hypothetical protein n=1 Tax=Novosphingobium sp. KCTC 2891 TaxID=2989730 RepID=UPI002222995E|nr:hypothetical protein [Novosphingobium sp. KCTC 2891]MCW1381303.1 hypothetical protein [Novosphingobium sp. KCTC 2891]
MPPISASPAPEPAPAPTNLDWRPYAALAAAIAAAAGAFVFWRRRAAQAPTVPEIVRPVPEPTPAPRTDAPKPTPAPAPFTPPTPASPLPEPRFAEPLVLTLKATRLSATLVSTTLSYRLVVANRGTAPMTDIAVGGDMTSAHASKSMDEQLGLTGPDFPPLHRIEHLGAGEEVAVPGEIRLPLSAITPIRNGEAALFVPLARFDAWASTPGGGAVHARAAFLIGQESAPAADRLQPFRLDLGPRIWADLGQRALALPDT